MLYLFCISIGTFPSSIFFSSSPSRDYPEGEEGAKGKTVSRGEDGAEGYVSSIKNVTQNMVGRISNLSRGGLGGLANKFSGGFLNF